MRVMAVAATHLSVRDGVRVRQVESTFHFQMAIEADLRRPLGIDNGVPRATALDMQASRAVTAFAADILGMHAMSFEPGVSRCGKGFVNFRVAFGAGRGPNKLSAGNFGRHDYHAVERYA